MFTTNVRGLIKNWNNINQINLENYDILLFNEIWQIKEYENINIAEFKLANLFQRTNQRGGGSVIYVRENIEFKTKESPLQEGIIETCAVEIGNTIICSLYRPPSGCKNTAIEKLIDWVETIGNKKIIIAGDWNINNLNNEKVFYNTIENATNLKTKIKSITRLSTGTCIDNVLTNLEGKFIVSNICIADHQGITMTVDMPLTIKIKKENFTYREFNETNWIKFSNLLDGLIIRGQEIDEKWSILLDDIKQIIEDSFPKKTRSKKLNFSMTQGLIKSKNRKNKLFKKYKLGQIEKEEYIRYNNIYRKLIYKIYIKQRRTNLKKN